MLQKKLINIWKNLKEKMETDEEVFQLKTTLENAGEFKPIESPMEKKIFKDKAGNKLTIKEYMSRWKQGISEITPYQQINIQLRSTMIMLFGVVVGFVITLFNFKTMWWVTLILGGVFGMTFMQLIGLIQRKRLLDKINGSEELDLDEALKGGSN